MRKTVIEVKNLVKKFDNQVILDNINLKIFEGETYGLLGPNGAGKTIFLQSLLGIIKPNSGTIKIFNYDQEKNLKRIHGQINFASSYSHLQEQITVMENLLTFADLYGIKNKYKKIKFLVGFFQLTKYIDKPTKVIKLSSGEHTRLLFCKALINNPKVLFLDEPTANLDPNISQKLLKLIKEIKKRRKMTIVYTSHNLLEAKNFCTRIGFLQKGKLEPIKSYKDINKILSLY